jgi:hypothetical protein
MDFSQFNGGEQATMTKVIEKKQASLDTFWNRYLPIERASWDLG